MRESNDRSSLFNKNIFEADFHTDSSSLLSLIYQWNSIEYNFSELVFFHCFFRFHFSLSTLELCNSL